jgi:hypothetical protein
MPKVQHSIKLVGRTVKGEVCKTHQAGLIHYFCSPQLFIHVLKDGKNVTVSTFKYNYTLTPHASIDNLWTGVSPNGAKTHFTKKKIVAKLIYWS